MGRLAGLSGALALALASAASGVSIANLSVTLDPTNSANFLDDAGNEAGQISSAAAVLSSSATAFATRYQAGVYSDLGGDPSVTNIITLNASYTIRFDVIDAVGSAWQLQVDTSRVGARNSVSDGSGQSAFSLSAVTGFLGGAGTLNSGSLGLASIPRLQQAFTRNLQFNQAGSATIDGTGNGSVTLNFTFTATAESIVNGAGNQGDEATIRMGIAENLSSFTAGMYPGDAATGVPNRPANDGHFVDLDLFDLGPIPEPDTALLLGVGLAALAIRRRAALRSA